MGVETPRDFFRRRVPPQLLPWLRCERAAVVEASSPAARDLRRALAVGAATIGHWIEPAESMQSVSPHSTHKQMGNVTIPMDW